jgi:hypothetical protein
MVTYNKVAKSTVLQLVVMSFVATAMCCSWIPLKKIL